MRILSLALIAATLSQPAQAGRNVYQDSIDLIKRNNPVILIEDTPLELSKKVQKLKAHGYIQGSRVSCFTSNFCSVKMIFIDGGME